ncbi:MAG TPA: hypothetical protein VK988_03355 [Acidimicrobiales bacterium]|nr:hypothetical protein [Acidimicrobiales bacterium]
MSRDSMDLLPDLPMYDSLTEALRRAVTDLAPAPPAESHDDDTDLPLPLRGNGGNHVPAASASVTADGEDVLALLDEALEPVPMPPLEVLRAAAVMEWVELVNKRLLLREDRRRLAREAIRVLDDEFRADLAADRLRKQGEHQAAIHRAKEAGTYWADRDRRRNAQQPTHVEVDPEAWAAMKAQAHGRGRSLGESIGYLVHAEVTRSSGRSKLPPLPLDRRMPSRSGRGAQLFARLVVSKPMWQEFRGLAARRGVTVARYVGLLVEAKVKMPEAASDR